MFRILNPGLDYNLVVVKSYLKLDPRQRLTSPSSFDIGRKGSKLFDQESNAPATANDKS